MVHDLRIMTRVFGFVPVDHDLRVMASTYRYHAAVVCALSRRDAMAAQSAMVSHIRVSRQTVLAGYDQRQRRGTLPPAAQEDQ